MNKKIMRQQLTAAYHLSYARFALNFYSYCEMAKEEQRTEENKEYDWELLQLTKALLSHTLQEKHVKDFRDKISQRMETLTFYVDCFQIYGYVLNHMEGRFKVDHSSHLDQEQAIHSMMNYIIDSPNALIMNRKIQSIMGELPVILTKNKFFSMVGESMSVLQGVTKQILEQQLYILKSSSMLSFRKEEREDFSHINETVDQFFRTDFISIGKETYDQLTKRFELDSEILMNRSSYYVQLQELVNDLYVILLSSSLARENSAEVNQFQKLISISEIYFPQKEIPIPEDEIKDLLYFMEGKQELYLEDYYRYALPENMEDEILRKISILLSDSKFGILDETFRDSSVVDRTYLNQQIEELTNQWSELFKKVGKPVARAIMAKILSYTPVFFKNLDQVQDYIRDNLECCTDIMEKETCIQLIQELMVSDHAVL